MRDDGAVRERVAAVGPVDVLLVAYGAPRQELWLDRNLAALGIPVPTDAVIGVLEPYLPGARVELALPPGHRHPDLGRDLGHALHPAAGDVEQLGRGHGRIGGVPGGRHRRRDARRRVVLARPAVVRAARAELPPWRPTRRDGAG